MTDSEKLQAILNYAKRSFDSAIIGRNFIDSMFYDNNDGTYTYDMVLHVHKEVSERALFYTKVTQIIEKPDEYLKEETMLEEYVKRIEATKEKIKNG